MDTESPTVPKGEITSSSHTKINWVRIIKILAVSLLSGGLFGTIGYFWGLNTGQSRSQIAQNQQYIIRTPSPPIVPSAAITTSVPTYTQSPSPTQVILPKLSSIPGWKVYTSPYEQVSFRYPDTWISAKTLFDSKFYNGQADLFSVQSPDQVVTVNWMSGIQGLGGGCDTSKPTSQGGCPTFTLMGKSPISGAPGLIVVSGIITKDGSTYQPFLAVQDSLKGGLTQSMQTMGYDEYPGRNNKVGDVIFSTGGVYAQGPSLSKADANAWFDKSSVQQAKQILESLTY